MGAPLQSAGPSRRGARRNLRLVHPSVPTGAMEKEEQEEGAEFALNDDCLEHIVACTSSGSTLFALARVSPTLQRLVLARLKAINVLVPVLWIYSHRALLKEPLRYIGARVWNQYVTYDNHVFHFNRCNSEGSWAHFLSHLPALKRIFLLCCCHNGLMDKVSVSPTFKQTSC